ncbi:MAG TPA: hypothetical protein VFW85_04005, partial [Gaiellaceae bacterium]|nr:hypothetical protein [Gaiellaceae bacterium]
MRRVEFERIFAAAVGAVALFLFAAATLVAVTLPYGDWDSLFYSTWSRLIGLNGNFHQQAVNAVDLHRPLFYVLQGELWHVFGFHEWIGRLLSLFFTVIFVAAVTRIAYHWGGLLGGASSCVVALALTDLAVHSSDGLTDVPTAATLAVVAAVLWTMRPGRTYAVLLVLASLIAVLTKPTGIIGCAALCAAQLIAPRLELRSRLRTQFAPVAVGVALGLVYDLSQARHLHMSLRAFLQNGVGSGITVSQSAHARPEALWGWMWLGRPLHLLLAFALIYAALRVVGLDHRWAVLSAAPASWIWAWVGPAIAGNGFHMGTSLSGIAAYLVAAASPALAFAPADRVPSRLMLARMLVWAAPAYVFWVLYADYDTRLLSAAWPALVLVLGFVFAGVIAGLKTVSVPAAVIAAAAVVVLAAVNVVELNGLGKSGWHGYWSGGVSGISDAALMRNVAYNQFEYELEAIDRQVRPSDKVFSEDARVGFFYPGQVNYEYPNDCADLAGYNEFVQLYSNESVTQAQQSFTTFAEAQRCPSLHLVGEASSYAVFTVGKPHMPPLPSACG